MKKLNKVAYDRLVIQAEEAKELGLDKLAEGVLSSIGSTSRDDGEHEVYSSVQLDKDVYNTLWKIAVNVLYYHDSKNVDISKVDETVSRLASVVLSEIESSLDLSNKVGGLEPKLPGEKE